MLKSFAVLFCFNLNLKLFDLLMGEPSTPSFLWFRDFRTCPWAPKPFIFIFGDTRTLQITQEKSQIIFHNITFEIWDLKILKLLEICVPHIFTFESYVFWNFETLTPWNSETLEVQNFETLKLRNQDFLQHWNQNNFLSFKSGNPQHPSTYWLPPLHPTTGIYCTFCNFVRFVSSFYGMGKLWPKAP